MPIIHVGNTEDASSLQASIIGHVHPLQTLINTSQKVLPPFIERPLILHPIPVFLHAPDLLSVVIRYRIRRRPSRRIDPVLLDPLVEVYLFLHHTHLH